MIRRYLYSTIMDNYLKNPLVSVILPTFNRGYCIQRSIKSVLCQTFPSFELIIVDDASTDETAQLISKIKDQRIKYIAHKKQLGAGASRNTGIKAAKGIYVAFQDSDDIWMADKLKEQVKALNKSNQRARAVFSAFWRINGNKKTYVPKASHNIYPSHQNLHSKLLYGNFIGTPFLLAEKELLVETGFFDQNLSLLEDWDLNIRIARNSLILFINKPLGFAYQGTDSISNQSSKFCHNIEKIIEKNIKSFEKHPAALALQYLTMLSYSFRERKLKKSIKYLLKSLRFSPVAPIYFGVALCILLRRFMIDVFFKNTND